MNEGSKMNVAALQFDPLLGDVEGNIARLADLAAETSADLLVIPELASTGYSFSAREPLADLAEEPERGPFCGWMRELSASRGMVVVGGFAERDPSGRLYNSALVALPDGAYRVYRKTHLFYKERLVFEPGDSGFFVCHWNGVAIGAMICYDWRFPEATRTLALRGAEVIAHPSNLVAAASLWRPTMRTRAVENKVIIATANRFGNELLDGEPLRFTGESQIVSYNGAVLADATATEAVVLRAEADPEGTRRKSFNPFNDIFADRRPELYEC
jgi:predicted amidohydrolase